MAKVEGIDPATEEIEVLLVENTIKKIIDEWDPFGLFPCAPDDEYQSESIAVSHGIKEIGIKKIKLIDLKNIIKNVFSISFGETLAIDEKEYIRIARKILNSIK